MALEGTATGAAVGTAISPGLGSVIGAGIGAAGDLIGGLFGSNESKKNRKEERRQFNEQMFYAKNQTQIRVEDALKAGINPLAALGVSANVSPTFSAGGGSGAGDYAASGFKGIGRAIKEYLDEKAYDDSTERKQQLESNSLDLESKRLQNRILRNQLHNITDVPGLDEAPPNRIGEKSVFLPIYDLQGRPRLMINQDATESDADNAAYISSLAHGIKQGFIDKVTGKVTSEQYRLLLDDQYYNMTGHHISNLDELYISPAEVAIAAAQVARGNT